MNMAQQQPRPWTSWHARTVQVPAADQPTSKPDVDAEVHLRAMVSFSGEDDAQDKRPTIVFLHFWGGSARTWSLAAPAVAARFRCVAVDLRGWGGSASASSAEGYSMADMARDMEGVVAEVVPGGRQGGVVLVGLSMGAKVAMLVARRRVVNVVGLVLVSPAPPGPLVLPESMREQQVHAYDGEELARAAAVGVLTRSFGEENKELPRFVVEDMLGGSAGAKAAWPMYGMAEDVSEGLEEVKIPILVLAADGDVVEPVERVREKVLGKLHEGARMVVLEGSGHLSPLDVPEKVAEHVIAFVEGLGSGGRFIFEDVTTYC
ncbi:alpha/beta-hydrolase [Echria macrotheca]|uniref:Alpha/beta-hydrolase n=1 Tax=Echria macrotheca TaxID=438768 RepID=A0AAJ0B924_9PEZI|nr:alpha/beta-hydrolase [Echria macrotheca]